MSNFENSDSDNNFSTGEDFVIDEELRELESQLKSDAEFLHATYPSNRSKSERLSQLITVCLAENQNRDPQPHAAGVNQTSDCSDSPGVSDKTPLAKENQNTVLGDSKTWLNIAMGTVASICLITCFVWFMPGHNSSIGSPRQGSIADVNSQKAVYEVTPVSLPAKFLNASQPELEAFYDSMCPNCDEPMILDDQMARIDF